MECMVLTLGKGSWRKINIVLPFDCTKFGNGGESLCINGAIHWLTCYGDSIVAFDLKDENFRLIPLPHGYKEETYAPIRLKLRFAAKSRVRGIRCERPCERDDANAICKIPLSRRRVADSVVWMHTKNGAYSVRSAYHVARRVMTIEHCAESSRSAEGQQIWKTLWRLKVPSKLKVFGWRACQEILPTRVSLAKRKILDGDRCRCCKRVAELDCHPCCLGMWSCTRCMSWKHHFAAKMDYELP
ncbi:hypothetical protein SO802_008905 [Lithocarpus litseifolius]|uniref:F-box associated domain-containing protein n=1 Tax=Lithocarpus litseifolius TaxID=425828 RepID=A0AAW2DCQ8_9ROSI